MGPERGLSSPQQRTFANRFADWVPTTFRTLLRTGKSALRPCKTERLPGIWLPASSRLVKLAA